MDRRHVAHGPKNMFAARVFRAIARLLFLLQVFVNSVLQDWRFPAGLPPGALPTGKGMALEYASYFFSPIVAYGFLQG